MRAWRVGTVAALMASLLIGSLSSAPPAAAVPAPTPTPARTGVPANIYAIAAATTAANGGYSLRLVPGTYKLQFVDPSGAHVTEWNLNRTGHATADPVTVVRSQTLRIDATLAAS